MNKKDTNVSTMTSNKLINTSIINYVEQSYFEYATYVIHDRALPFIGDGLKPVARRIVYAMRELSLHHKAKHKKSARTIGDVLGKFHPHGDSACYEAMVLMAQSFSYRYPFIDGQGNWGSIDEPKSFAAMRYTEARLSGYADSLLEELGPNIVKWSENFDGTLKEPAYLPARLPNVILNGAMGIAVGISTDIAPHNIFECVEALLEIIHHPESDDDQILQHILGPDLPTGGVLTTPREELIQAYKTGSGNYRVRATYETAPKVLTITSLPYQISTSRIMRQIADLVLSKKLPGVEDIRDDSDEMHPVRIGLLLKGNPDPTILMQIIFAHTDCEKSYRMQQFILNRQHRPELFSLPKLLREWLEFRKDIVRNRLRSNIQALESRLHILEGLKIITLHLDEVIKIIRYEDDPDTVLATRYSLSELQVKAILEIRLKQLTKVEWLTLDAEHQKKQKDRDAFALCLNNEKHFSKLLEKELKADAAQFGNPRRTLIQPQEAATKLIPLKDTITKELLKVFLSNEHWIRSSRNLSIQANTLQYHSSDGPYLEATGYSDQHVLIWSPSGQVYGIPAHTIASVRGKGDPLTQWIDNAQGVMSMMMGDDGVKILVISSDGYGFITSIEHAKTRLKSGKLMVSLPEGQVLRTVLPLSANVTHVGLLSQQGRLVILALDVIPFLKKGRGVKLMGLSKEELAQKQDAMNAACLLSSAQSLQLVKQDQNWTQTPKQWLGNVCKRGQRGMHVPRNFRSFSTIEGVAIPDPEPTP